MQDIQILSPANQRQLVQLNRPLAVKENIFIHDLIAQQAKLRPEAQAIHAWDGDLSYSQLQQLAERFGQFLSMSGVGPETIVPIIFEKSVYSIIAVLGVVRAGGAVVALDPQLPDGRLKMIIEDVQASVVISSAQCQHRVPSRIQGNNRVIVDKAFMTRLPSVSTQTTSPPPSTDTALYVVYTSGSTGKPKGVVVTHAAFASSARGYSKAIHLDSPLRRALQYSSFSFDISMLEIFTTLMVGACLCIPSEEQRMNNLASCISSMSVNWAMLTPSVASLMTPEEVPGLEVLCLVGEALPQSVADRWADRVKTINGYGPAECSAITIVDEPRVRGKKSVSIGRPPNCAVWIVGENDGLAPFNSIGEIIIEGPPVARGYLGDETRTKEVFLENPKFLQGVVRDPGRCYRTGDLGSMNPDGSIDFVGRKDSQVKINGQRVELGEIEYHLKSAVLSELLRKDPINSSVEVVVEMIYPREGQLGVLSAFIASRDSASGHGRSENILLEESDLSWGRIKSMGEDVLGKLMQGLPLYMVPKAIVPCRRLPLSPSGKVDRKALRSLGNSMTLQQLMQSSTQPNIVSSTPLDQRQCVELSESDQESSIGQDTLLSEDSPSSEASVPASLPDEEGLSPIKRSLRQAWAKILGLSEESISLDDDFFKLGGDSIAAIKVVAACRQLKLQINVSNIFKNSVLRKMALVCKSSAADELLAFSSRFTPFQFFKTEEISVLREEVSLQCGVKPESIEDLYPCTHMQEGLMAVNLTRPGSYTGRWIHPLPKDVDLARFRKAWEDIHAASPVLRTRFAVTSTAGSLQAVMREQVQWLASDNLDEYLKDDDANPMFPGDSLNRFALITSLNGDRTFVWTIHHMLYDGWSLAMLCKRLNEAYHGRTMKPATDYRKFISYTQKLQPSSFSQFWKDELCGVPQSTFPSRPKPGHQSFARAVVRDSLQLDLDPTSGVTMSTLVRAAWALMISHYSKSEDVLFGATVSGRNAPLDEIENIEGPTIATVPVRVRLSRDSTIHEYLRQVQDRATAIIPFEQAGIQHIKALNEDTKRGCEFQNLLVVQAGGGWDEIGSGPLGKPIYREEFTTFPVTCEVWLHHGRVEFATHVDEDVTTRIFVAEAIEIVKIVMVQLSQALSSNAKFQTISSLVYDKLPLPASKPQGQDIQEAEVSKSIHDLISGKSREQAKKEAIVSTSDTITYEDLERMSSALSTHLTEIGVAPGAMIPLCFEKSVWTIVAMLGVMKAGAAFVPLDPGQPISRLRNIIKEIKANIALTSAFHSKATNLGLATQIIVDRERLDQLPKSHDPCFSSNPQHPAYVIFTSGSTGQPKGVIIPHSAFAHGAVSHGKLLGMSNNHRVLQFSSYTFDASLFEILTTLIHGGTVCVPSDKERVEGIEDFMKETNVNLSLLTPSVARFIAPSEVPLLKTLVLGGEAPDESLIKKWLDAGTRLFNAYGPSECSVIAAIHAYSPRSDPRTIGVPAGCSCWVVDPEDDSALVENGEAGELLIEGQTLAQGYLNDHHQTSTAFIDTPCWGRNDSRTNNSLFYKTGDLVRKDPDGTLIYIGRKDLQVKVHGQRVELGDIESHLTGCNSVKRGIVVFPSTGIFQDRLVAVLDLDLQDRELRSAARPQSRLLFEEQVDRIKADLSGRIPSIMIPTHWINITRISSSGFPLSASGKVDRRLITSLLEELSMTQSESLIKLASAHNESLSVGPDEKLAYGLALKIQSLVPAKFSSARAATDHFDDMLLSSSGLDSLTMMSLMQFVRITHRVRVGMQFLMNETTTIRSLASFIESSTAPESTTAASPQTSVRTVDIMAEIERYQTELLTPLNAPSGVNKISPKGHDLTVFLTGATGYLGTQILRQLLERPDVSRVVALARGSTAEVAKTRVIETALKALWWTEFHEEKLEVWKGDLGVLQLGLTESQWERLADGCSFDIIIHNGAVVHWNKSYSALEAVNVRSTVQLAALALQNPGLRFTYVSGGRQCRSEDECEEDVVRELSDSMGYSQSKFVAETLVKRVAERRPVGQRNIAVFRPGLIIGTPTEGVANLDDYIWRLAAACIDIGAYNADDNNAWLSLSDASTTAASAINTAFSPQSLARPVSHQQDGMTWGAFWSLVKRRIFSRMSRWGGTYTWRR
ncbi:amino acid adenylation domain-containing protein [Colletotrichum karsti]|uniref:Amino acid adenylation domain-containing protein n=1 Tax=Colletotrichum karsti TaxID=1095194 RepID=A0A9P6I9E7_9PEZI|nr:amino acid adenylation domain-containing protein [Colletotrichum karsti]KAF9876381.1 amino acid adenylation domain-containing protein [Colletotrichum karsti]